MYCGALLIDFVSNESGLEVSRKVVWSDSSCVLSWIHSKELSTVFVANRVKRIRATPELEFRHVPTACNPADLLSRGTDWNLLVESETWWKGPKWLVQPDDQWPEINLRVKKENPEPLESESLTTSARSVSEEETLFDVSRFSSLRSMYKVTCWVFRALNIFSVNFVMINYPEFSGNNKTAGINATEMAQARMFWDRRMQKQSFPAGTQSWPKGQENLKRQLGLFRDRQKLLRCRSRVGNSKELAYNSKFPILLPRNNEYTNLVIKECHENALHGGPQSTLAAVRNRYWVPQARNVVKQVLRKCCLCRRHAGGPFRIPEAPPLPEFRVSIWRPFACVGLDYLGPLVIRDKEDDRKVWVALFTCAAIRAIYLDVVSSLNTKDFLLCLRRFMGTYGKPDMIVSDNAKQFHMADKVLKMWLDVLRTEEVQTCTADQGIEWKFITELSPWMGGFYERMIRPVKDALRKSIGSRKINQEELQTLLFEIAAVVNERPLLYQGTEPGEQVLTPSHLLFRSRELFPEVAEVDEYREKLMKADELVTHWKQGQKVLRQFWDSWKNLYLTSLRERNVLHKQRAADDTKAAIDMTVLIKDNLPRGTWRFGRIESLIPSADGEVRSAKIRLANGHVLPRPLKLLCPLEMSAEIEQGAAQQGSKVGVTTQKAGTRPKRRAAELPAQRTKQQLQEM